MSENRRVLVVDDTVSIHEDFRKILGKKSEGSKAITDMKAALFGAKAAAPTPAAAAGVASTAYELDFASQGPEALEKVQAACAAGKPYTLAFVDVRMPPGWDGVQTLKRIWQVDPNLQAVLCTAYSDYSWEQTIGELGQTDRLLILKKPFEPVEICQTAAALSAKWNSGQRERDHLSRIQRAEMEARAYASSLETVNRALLTAKAAADRSSQMKTDFLLHLSDQIHGSLQSILDQATRLGGHSNDSLGLSPIITATHALLSTFHETLDITLIEAGSLQLTEQACSPRALLEEVLALRRAEAEAKNIEIRLDLPKELPETIHTDPVRFQQVLAELVHNAIDHTSKGMVCVSARVEQTEDWQHPLLRCEISDTGCGIPEEHRGKIFEPFFTHQRTKMESFLRPGLGLTVAKQLAKLLGGDLTVESTSPSGTTFALTIGMGSVDGVRLVTA